MTVYQTKHKKIKTNCANISTNYQHKNPSWLRKLDTPSDRMTYWIYSYSSSYKGAYTCWGMDWWPCCDHWQEREISWVWTGSDFEWDMTGYSMTSSHSPYPFCQSIHRGTTLSRVLPFYITQRSTRCNCPTQTLKYIFTPIPYQDILGGLSARAAVRRDEPCSDWSLKIKACFDWSLGAAWLDGLEGHGAHWVTGGWARTNGGHCTTIKFNQPGCIMKKFNWSIMDKRSDSK